MPRRYQLKPDMAPKTNERLPFFSAPPWPSGNQRIRRLKYPVTATDGVFHGMGLWRAIKRKMRASVAPVVFLSVTAYFCSNATQGELGLKAYEQRRHDLAMAQLGLARAQSDQAVWEHRVAALHTAHIGADALDERARAMLNLSDPADVVVPYAQNAKLF